MSEMNTVEVDPKNPAKVPGIGVARHADAGYEEAWATAKEHGVRIPMTPRDIG